MKDIFISYAREDSNTASKLSDALELEGLSVWWDRKISAGQTFDQVIKEQLDQSQCVIVLWSNASVSSNWVLDEVSEAQSQKKLVPVLIDDVQIPMGFRRIQAADLKNWSGKRTDPAFQLLIESVKRTLTTTGLSKSRSNKEEPIQSRTKVSWLANIVVIAALAFFYLTAVSQVCFKDDLLAFSALIGFPLSVFLIFQKRLYRIAWIALPLISFLIGMPYGHNYGSMTKSPLFGLQQGTQCQPSPVVLVILGVVAVAAVIDHAVLLHNNKRR